MIVKIVNKSKHENPKYATIKSSGLDLKADIPAPIIISPMERAIIPTNLYIQLSEGYEAQIRPRSGLAAKSGITVLNSPGTIDNDYTGHIQVILMNLSSNEFIVNDGDRIAQMVIAPFVQIDFKNVDDVIEFDQTERASGGFGSTGKN